MANMNKVILAGNLTRDPQLSYMPNNTAVCELGMAINRKWKAQNGEMKEDTCFVDMRAYGRPAETLNQYMQKGKPLLVEGRLKFDQWEGKDGQKRSKLYVVVENFQFLGAPTGARQGEGGGGSSGYQRSPARGAQRPAPVADGIDEQPPMTEEAPADEIPF